MTEKTKEEAIHERLKENAVDLFNAAQDLIMFAPDLNYDELAVSTRKYCYELQCILNRIKGLPEPELSSYIDEDEDEEEDDA
jgi:hypothetical protein